MSGKTRGRAPRDGRRGAGGTRLPKGREMLAQPRRCRIVGQSQVGLVELPGPCPCVRFHPSIPTPCWRSRPVLGRAFLFQGYFGMIGAFVPYNSGYFPFSLKSKGPFVSPSCSSPQEYQLFSNLGLSAGILSFPSHKPSLFAHRPLLLTLCPQIFFFFNPTLCWSCLSQG